MMEECTATWIVEGQEGIATCISGCIFALVSTQKYAAAGRGHISGLILHTAKRVFASYSLQQDQGQLGRSALGGEDTCFSSPSGLTHMCTFCAGGSRSRLTNLIILSS